MTEAPQGRIAYPASLFCKSAGQCHCWRGRLRRALILIDCRTGEPDLLLLTALYHAFTHHTGDKQVMQIKP
jgi:hypothetical protein